PADRSWVAPVAPSVPGPWPSEGAGLAARREGRPANARVATAIVARTRAATIKVAVDDTPFGEVVRRHFERNLVAGQNADVVFAHFAAGIGDNGVAVIQHNAEARIGQYFGDFTTNFDKFFFSHILGSPV